MRNITFCLITLLALSCSSNDSNSNKRNEQLKPNPVVAVATLAKDTIDFELQTFGDIPSEIDGCGCYFFLSKKEEADKKYLFANDFASVAFVSINGKIKKFNLAEHKEGSDIYLYHSDKFVLKIEISKRTSKGEETSIVEGVLTLSVGDKVIRKNFVGSCGC
jgi:hypothetical protein